MTVFYRGYAVLAYAAFLVASGWSALFLAGWGIDGPATLPAWGALAVDGVLLGVFAAHHSVLARAGVKRRLGLPARAERSTYVLVASLLLIAVAVFWEPVPAVVWDAAPGWWALYVAGWALVAAATFMVDHADFLGLRQAYQRDYRPPGFTARWLYAWCRHPMMLGLLIVVWATPRMTAGHLFFAGASTVYIAIGVRLEERDLRAAFGEEYRAYARRVPFLAFNVAFRRVGWGHDDGRRARVRVHQGADHPRRPGRR